MSFTVYNIKCLTFNKNWPSIPAKNNNKTNIQVILLASTSALTPIDYGS